MAIPNKHGSHTGRRHFAYYCISYLLFGKTFTLYFYLYINFFWPALDACPLLGFAVFP
jgi:hypothetical protein